MSNSYPVIIIAGEPSIPDRFSSNVQQERDVALGSLRAPPSIPATLLSNNVFVRAGEPVTTSMAPPVASALFPMNVHQSNAAESSSSRYVLLPVIKTPPPTFKA